jgi:hypothetical protein
MAGDLSDIPDYGNLGSNIDTSGFSQFTPTYAGGTDTTGAGGSTDWQKALKAATALGDATKGTGPGQGVANLPGAGFPTQARPNTGVPAHAGALNALLQMLGQRRDMYMQAAVTPGAAPVPQPTKAGLLGF